MITGSGRAAVGVQSQSLAPVGSPNGEVGSGIGTACAGRVRPSEGNERDEQGTEDQSHARINERS